MGIEKKSFTYNSADELQKLTKPEQQAYAQGFGSTYKQDINNIDEAKLAGEQSLANFRTQIRQTAVQKLQNPFNTFSVLGQNLQIPFMSNRKASSVTDEDRAAAKWTDNGLTGEEWLNSLDDQQRNAVVADIQKRYQNGEIDDNTSIESYVDMYKRNMASASTAANKKMLYDSTSQFADDVQQLMGSDAYNKLSQEDQDIVESAWKADSEHGIEAIVKAFTDNGFDSKYNINVGWNHGWQFKKPDQESYRPKKPEGRTPEEIQSDIDYIEQLESLATANGPSGNWFFTRPADNSERLAQLRVELNQAKTDWQNYEDALKAYDEHRGFDITEEADPDQMYQDPIGADIVRGTGETAINAMAESYHRLGGDVAGGFAYGAEQIEKALGIGNAVSQFFRRSEKGWRSMQNLAAQEKTAGSQKAMDSLRNVMSALGASEETINNASEAAKWIESNIVESTFSNIGRMLPSAIIDIMSGGATAAYDIYKAGAEAFGALGGRTLVQQFASGIQAAMSNPGFGATFTSEFFGNLADKIDNGQEPTPTDIAWMMMGSYVSSLIEYGGDDVASGFQAVLQNELGGLKGFIHSELGETVEEVTQTLTERVSENMAAALQGRFDEIHPVYSNDISDEALINLAEIWDTAWRTMVSTAGMSGIHYISSEVARGVYIRAARGQLTEEDMEIALQIQQLTQNAIETQEAHEQFEQSVNGEDPETARDKPMPAREVARDIENNEGTRIESNIQAEQAQTLEQVETDYYSELDDETLETLISNTEKNLSNAQEGTSYYRAQEQILNEARAVMENRRNGTTKTGRPEPTNEGTRIEQTIQSEPGQELPEQGRRPAETRPTDQRKTYDEMTLEELQAEKERQEENPEGFRPDRKQALDAAIRTAEARAKITAQTPEEYRRTLREQPRDIENNEDTTNPNNIPATNRYEEPGLPDVPQAETPVPEQQEQPAQRPEGEQLQNEEALNEEQKAEQEANAEEAEGTEENPETYIPQEGRDVPPPQGETLTDEQGTPVTNEAATAESEAAEAEQAVVPGEGQAAEATESIVQNPEEPAAPTTTPAEENNEVEPQSKEGSYEEEPTDEGELPHANTKIEQETEEYAKQYGFKSGATQGDGRNDTGVHLNGAIPNEEQRRELQLGDLIAKASGTSVEFRSELLHNANGLYDGDNIIYLSAETEHPLSAILGHEAVHVIQKFSPTSAKELERLFRERAVRTKFDIESRIESIINNHLNHGLWADLSVEQRRKLAMDEIVANYAAPALADPEFARQLYGQDRNLVERVIDWAKQVQARIQEMLKRFANNSPEAKLLMENEREMRKVQEVAAEALRDIKELNEVKKAATSTHGNGKISRRYERMVDQATSKEQVNIATRETASDVLEQTGNKINDQNIQRVIWAALDMVQSSGATPADYALKNYELKTDGIDVDTRRALQMMGNYVWNLQRNMDTEGFEALMNGVQEDQYHLPEETEKEEAKSFEYMKPFAEQLKDFKKTKNDPNKRSELFKESNLLVSNTPMLWQKLGMPALPISMKQEYVQYGLDMKNYPDPRYVDDHKFDIKEFEKLPDKLNEPVAIIYDPQNTKGAITVMVDMVSISGRQVIVPIEILAPGRIEGDHYDMQLIKTVHGNKAAIGTLKNAILQDSENNIKLFYINKEKAKQLVGEGVLNNVVATTDGLVHNITDNGSPVKDKFFDKNGKRIDQTKTQQFRKWFRNSVVRNSNGSAKIVYHGTPNNFTVFKPQPKGDGSHPYFYFSESKEYAENFMKLWGYKNANIMETYLSIQDALDLTGRKTASEWADYIKTNGIKLPQNYFDNLTKTYGDNLYGWQLFRDDTGVFEDALIKARYDGIKTDERSGDITWVVFDSRQVKSATNNNGMFDPENPDIRYSLPESKREAKYDATKAEKYFGTTTNLGKSGYLTTNGKLLDMSGKHEGYDAGHRTVDHRDIQNAYEEEMADIQGTEAMIDFMRDGNIRLSPESDGIDLMTMPNEKQIQILKQFIRKAGGEVIVDISDQRGNTIESFEYDSGTQSQKVIDDLRGYFDYGIVPEEFKYSLNEESTRAGQEMWDRQTEFTGGQTQALQKLSGDLWQAIAQRKQQQKAENYGQWKAHVAEMAQTLLEATNSKVYDQKKLEQRLTEILEEHEKMPNGTPEEAQHAINNTLNELQGLIQEMLSDQLLDDEYKSVKRALKNGIYVNPDQVKENGGAAELRDLRNALSGFCRVYTSEKAAKKAGALWLEGGGWDELQKINPDLFNPDTHWLERLQAIRDFVDQHSDSYLRDDPMTRDYIRTQALETLAEYYSGSAETDATKRTRDALKKANNKVSSLQKQLEQQMKAQADLADQLRNEKKNANAAIRQAQNEAFADKNTLAQQLKAAQDQTKATSDELSKVKGERAKLRDELNRADSRLDYLNSTIELLREQNKKNKTEAVRKDRARAKQRAEDKKNRDNIKKTEMKMRRMLEKPSNTAYVPLDKVRKLLDMMEAIQKADTRKAAQATDSWMRAVRELREDTNSLLKDAYDEGFIAQMQEVADIVKDKTLNQLSSEELQYVSNVMTQALHQIENATKMIGRQKNADALMEGHSWVDTLNAQKPQPTGGIGKVVNNLATEHLTPQRELDKLAGYRKDNAIYRAKEELSEGQRVTNKVKMDQTRNFEELISGKNAQNFKKWTGKKADVVDTGIQGSRHGTFKMTHDFLTSLYLHNMNQQNLDGMKSGLTVPDYALWKEGKHKEAWDRAERMYVTADDMKRLMGMVTDYDKAWAKAWKQNQAYITPILNDVSMQLNGWHRFAVENYFPIRRDRNYLATDFDSIMLDDRIANMGFTKMRKNAKNPMMLESMLDVVNRTINGTSLYAGMLIPVTNFNKAFNMSMPDFEDSPKAALRRVWGNKEYEYIERMMKDLQQAGIRADESIFDKVRSKAAPAALGANPTVVIKQAASYPTAAAVLGWKPLAQQLTKPRKFDQKITDKYTSAYWERSDANIQAMNANVQSGGIDRTSSVLNKPIGAMDRATVRMIWGACEYAVEEEQPNLKRGSDEYYEAVARKYEECLEMTQPEYGTMQRPHIMRSNNTLQKTSTMYKTQAFQNFNIVYDAVQDVRTQAKAYKENPTAENKAELDRAKTKLARAVSSQIVSATVLAVMTAVGKALLHKPEPYQDDKGEVTAASAAYQMSKDAISSMAGMVTGGSELFDLITGIMEGKAPYDIDASAISMINDLYQSIYKLGNAATIIGDGSLSWDKKLEKGGKAVDNFLKSAGALLGIPYNNMRNIGTSVYKYADDILSGRGLEGLTTGDVTLTTAARYMGEALQRGNKDAYVRLYNRLLKQGKTASQINSAMKSWMKTSDPRIQQAATAIDSGDIDTYNMLINQMTADGYGMANVVTAIEAVRKAAAESSEEGGVRSAELENAPMTYDQIIEAQENADASAYTYAQMNQLLDSGNTRAAVQVQKALFKSKGTTAVKSALTSYWKPKYQEAYQNRNRTELNRITRLLKTMGYSDQSINKWKNVESTTTNTSSKKTGFGSGTFGSSFGKKSSSKKSSSRFGKRF